MVSVGWHSVPRVWPGHLSQVLTKGLSLVVAKGLSLEVCAMEAAVAAIHCSPAAAMEPAVAAVAAVAAPEAAY